MQATVTLEIAASRYVDDDDSLAAAASDVAAVHDLAGWDLRARWQGGDEGPRDVILVDVPAWSQVAA